MICSSPGAFPTQNSFLLRIYRRIGGAWWAISLRDSIYSTPDGISQKRTSGASRVDVVLQRLESSRECVKGARRLKASWAMWTAVLYYSGREIDEPSDERRFEQKNEEPHTKFRDHRTRVTGRDVSPEYGRDDGRLFLSSFPIPDPSSFLRNCEIGEGWPYRLPFHLRTSRWYS
jgi:hypothetical protein